MKLLPVLLPLVAMPLRARSAMASPVAAPAATPDAAPPPASDRDRSAEPDWRSAYLRLREREPTEPAPVLPVLAVLARPSRQPAPEVAEVRSAAATPTATAARLEAVRLLAQPGPSAPSQARVWQVELPAAGPGWQLHLEQAQPLAPLAMELRVPKAAQSQARQQLGDLDKRLREAGHDVLRPRVRTARAGQRSRPVDEAQP
jgi:hypothetical protein